jgi:hypothetical protein
MVSASSDIHIENAAFLSKTDKGSRHYFQKPDNKQWRLSVSAFPSRL